jgi:hypothetical protein
MNPTIVVAVVAIAVNLAAIARCTFMLLDKHGHLRDSKRSVRRALATRQAWIDARRECERNGWA